MLRSGGLPARGLWLERQSGALDLEFVNPQAVAPVTRVSLAGSRTQLMRASAEIAKMQRAWFQCPRCQCDWEVRINDDRVVVMPVLEHRG
jgi:hypothetical protein